MKFLNILTELYVKPWLIVPSMHEQICSIVKAHKDGDTQALALDLISEDSEMDKIGNVALIPIHGVIGKHVSQIEKSSGVADVADIEINILNALEDESVEGIMFDIDSPGGSVSGVPEVSRLIASASKLKPTVAYVDQLMASAATWMGVGARAIYASQSAQVGSIGVYMAFLDQTRALEMAGMKLELIKAGKYKAMGMPGKSITAEEREILQAGVDKVYGWFTSFVLEHRDVKNNVMQGQMFYAEDAVKNGLIDRVGSFNDAINELQAMIGFNRK